MLFRSPRSAPERSPRALRERVPPELRLATPPRMLAGRATASGHRAVPKHEAKLCEELERGERRGQRALAVTEMTVGIVPMVEANGSKPISPLSVAAELHCVAIKELQLGRRAFNSPA